MCVLRLIYVFFLRPMHNHGAKVFVVCVKALGMSIRTPNVMQNDKNRERHCDCGRLGKKNHMILHSDLSTAIHLHAGRALSSECTHDSGQSVCSRFFFFQTIS